VYEKFTGAVPSGQAAVIDSRLVVSRYWEPNGMGGTRTQWQRYGDLRYYHANEASLGFGWIEAYDPLTRQTTRTEPSRVYPFGGSPIFSETTVELTQSDIDAMASNVPLSPGIKSLTTDASTYAEMSAQVGI